MDERTCNSLEHPVLVYRDIWRDWEADDQDWTGHNTG